MPAAEPLLAVPVAAAPPPFTVGRVIGRSFTLWKQNLLAFAALVLVLQAPNLVLTLLAGPQPGPGDEPDFRYALLTFVNVLLSLFLSLVSAGALTQGVLQALAGKRVSAGALLAFGVRSFWRLFVVSLAVGLRVFLWSLLLLVPGIMAMCRLFVAIPAAVAEPDRDSTEIVARSGALTEGKRLSIFLVMLVFWLVAFTVSMVAGVLGVASGVVPFAVGALITWAMSAITNGLGSAATGVAYHDLRLEKEGADTAQLAAVFE